MSDAESTKYRVAGAIVILISLMIAWFLLLKFDEKRIQHVASRNIPKPVLIETFDVPSVSDVVIMPPSNVIEKSEDLLDRQPQKNRVITIDKKAVTEKQKPVTKYTHLNDKNQPQAWVLQVASFKDKSNAQKLQKVLLKDEYPAYIKEFTVNNQKTFRVLVGPKLSKERAQLMSEAIASKYKLRSLVMDYKPGFSE